MKTNITKTILIAREAVATRLAGIVGFALSKMPTKRAKYEWNKPGSEHEEWSFCAMNAKQS